MSVSFSQLILAVVLLPFFWIGVDWLFDLLADRREVRRLRQLLRICHLCGKGYPEGKRVKLSTCPECSAQNVRGGHRKLG
ncbi:MAG: hypothetical protein ACJAVK_003170 [Akkermansiaceae bacterium]|jgi:hypothetical protein